MIGIYKITNPQKEIYIGCSTNIDKRFKKYSYIDCINQPNIYKSMMDFGFENHLFEIIEECDINTLLERERFWIEYYDCFENGLNKNRGGYGTIKHSESTKNKISEARKGWKPSIERGLKISEKIKGRKYSEEHKKNISNSLIGKGKSFKGRTSPNKGNKYSDETRSKMSNSFKGKKLTEETKLKIGASNSTPILQYDLKGNFLKAWDSISIAKRHYPKGDINNCLRGKQKKAGGFIWRKNEEPLCDNFNYIDYFKHGNAQNMR